MKGQQIHLIELTAPQQISNPKDLKNTKTALQTAILQALLKNGDLSKQQFDLCIEKL